MSVTWDVAIAGGGATGLTLALALRTLSQGALRVALIDQSDPALRSGPRTSALAEGPRRMLERLSVWTGLEGVAQPILRMDISEARSTDAVKSGSLSFAAEGGAAPLAHMLFHRDFEPQLLAAATEKGVRIIEDTIESAEFGGSAASLRTGSGETIHARLLVGADGLRSRTRAAARIPVVSWPYESAAIVLTIAHEADHEGVAIQHFLESGPFASLPVTGRRSSIVWTEPSVVAAKLLTAPKAELIAELEVRLAGRLGALDIEEGPQSFPLVFQLARSFAGQRLALIGDAAHRVHPLAGQGLNIGMRDVATLAELVIEQAKLGLDVGSADLLSQYERRRRFDAAASAAAFDFIHAGYQVQNPLARAAKRMGMRALDSMESLKRALNREASGLLGDNPALFR